MKSRRPEPSGLLLIRAWLEPSPERTGAYAVRARVTTVLDVLADDGETYALAGTDAVVAAVERWLAELSLLSRS